MKLIMRSHQQTLRSTSGSLLAIPRKMRDMSIQGWCFILALLDCLNSTCVSRQTTEPRLLL